MFFYRQYLCPIAFIIVVAISFIMSETRSFSFIYLFIYLVCTVFILM